MCRSLTSLFLFFAVVMLAKGQILPFQRYSSKEGLNNKGAYAVISDSRGLLWVGTPFGVNWFDGEQFSVPRIESKTGQLYVTHFFRDSRDDIWVLTFYNGLYRFHNNEFKNFLPDSANLESTANNVFDMVELGEQQYLVATDKGALLFNGKQFELLDTEHPEMFRQITCLAAIGKEEILVASKGVHRYTKTLSGWKLQNSILSGQDVNRLLIHHDSLWVATDNGLLAYDLDEKHSDKPLTHYLSGNQIRDIAVTPTGDLAVASNGAFIIHNGKIHSITAGNGFTTSAVYDIYCNDGLTWFASNDGLFRLEEKIYAFDRFDTATDPSSIGAIAMDGKNQLWLTLGNTVVKKTRNGYSVPITANGKKLSGAITFHLDRQRNFRAATSNGLFLFPGKGAPLLEVALPVSALFEDEERIWFGTTDGHLYALKDHKIKRFYFPTDQKEFISAIYKSKDDLWIGLRSGGIQVYTLRGDSCVMTREFTSKNGFVNLRVRSFFSDGHGNLIVGTRTNGMFIFPTVSPGKYVHFTKEQGLSGNWVKAITSDNAGKLYLATNNGINTLQLGQYDPPSIRQLQFGNDAISKEINSVLFDGRAVWAGTYSGLLYYLPETDRLDKTTPPIYLTKAVINGKPDSLLMAYSQVEATRQFSYEQNVIAFEFAGIDLKANGKLKYRYRLRGQDEDWNEGTERNFVSYHLSPGTYTFEVQAKNSNERWSINAATYSFYIAKPFWQTGWFIALVSVFVLGIIYFINNYRLQQVIKLEKLRSKISADLHDDIGSTLSSISILSDLATRDKNGEAFVMMAEIKTNSIQLMEKMDDIVWSINPKNDSLENLLLRIRQFASRLFEAKNIEYDISIDESIRQLKLPMEYRQHIYLLMKEAINNLVKYAECNQASIHVTKNQSNLHVVIRDNGKGFVMHECADRNGMLSMQSRASFMNATLNINTAPEEGTCITLEVKIK
jgi:signal transduction histidine kinase/ligand-binding sensor domain-containing protein